MIRGASIFQRRAENRGKRLRIRWYAHAMVMVESDLNWFNRRIAYASPTLIPLTFVASTADPTGSSITAKTAESRPCFAGIACRESAVGIPKSSEMLRCMKTELAVALWA